MTESSNGSPRLTVAGVVGPVIHGQGAASAPAAPATTQPSAAPDTVTPTTPLPPPLPAEVGGG